MFLLLGSYYVDTTVTGADASATSAAGPASAAAGRERSRVVELLPPPVAACRGPHPMGTIASGDASVSHAGHAAHGRHAP